MTRTAFFPGTFDPVTNGHVDLLRQALGIADKVVVAIGVNSGKSPMFTLAERKAMIDGMIKALGKKDAARVTAVHFEGLAVDAARNAGAAFIVRGLRDARDFDYEMQMAAMNAALASDVATVFLPASPATRHITATLIRQIAGMGGDVAPFVPANVAKAIAKARRADFTSFPVPEVPVDRFLAILAVALVGILPLAAKAATLDPENTILPHAEDGRVVIKLRPDLAPNHVERVKELTRAHFYDGLTFHRVIPGFMAQTGDPKGDGTGGSDKPDLRAEFKPAAHFLRGTIGAARSQDPNSANSQFFICLADAPWLDGAYTVWGEVVEGMEFVDEIKQGDPNVDDGRVNNPARSSRCRSPPTLSRRDQNRRHQTWRPRATPRTRCCSRRRKAR